MQGGVESLKTSDKWPVVAFKKQNNGFRRRTAKGTNETASLSFLDKAVI